LSSDYLGAPFVATGINAAEIWSGGFEPFGRDWREGTPDGAQENGVFLRSLEQWFDNTWAEAALGAEVVYNVHRWYEWGTGRYTRSDPELYYDTLPVVSSDLSVVPASFPSSNTLFLDDVVAQVICDGCGGFKWVWRRGVIPFQCLGDCATAHEEDHIQWLQDNTPDACKGQRNGANPRITQNQRACSECSAHTAGIKCLKRKRKDFKGDWCLRYVKEDLKLRRMQKKEECKLCREG
jgi:hypothetical protein